jgi:predicted transcriptional regulator
MTKHEALSYLVGSPGSTKKGMSGFFSIAYTTASDTLNRLHTQKLIYITGKLKRRSQYVLTDKGLDRLSYFDEHGCRNQDCLCHREDQ